jgi:L-fucose isomerase-like protein
MVVAHCTIPFDMVESYELDTHFESGIGVGIRGRMHEGGVTIVKLAGDCSRMFVAEGELLRNESKPDLCRTQLAIGLDKPRHTAYFLTRPIGNHHVIVAGRWKEQLKAIAKYLL